MRRQFHFGRRVNAALAALIPITCPGQVESDRVAAVIASLESFVSALPWFMRRGFSALVLLFEISAVAWPAGGGVSFSKLQRDAAARYFDRWWHSRLSLLAEAARTMKMMTVFCYYELPAVKSAMGYDPEAWVAKVKAERLARYGSAISEAEKAVTAPDPLPVGEAENADSSKEAWL
ncbi:MAG: hypothetical protein HYV63_16455 [Candidatus Schekmanbacteria bacterium]|nr:hypothetical protein [Candidatus Schekmanbacteria bacterium]